MNESVQESKVTVFIGLSVDGFIARPDGSLDWLPGADGEAPDDPIDEDAHGYDALMERTDALLMGRTTYDTVLGFDVDWPYSKPVYVLTNRDLDKIPDGADVRIVAGKPAEVLEQLASNGHHHIYIDGGNVIQQFLRAHLVNDLILTRIPVLIGEGIPLFGPLEGDVTLQHVDTKDVGGGLVQSHYTVR